MKRFLCFLLVSLFMFSLVVSLPEPPPSPSIGESSQNSASSESLKNTSLYNNVTVESNSNLIYFLIGFLVLLIFCLILYYFFIKQKKDLNINMAGDKNEKEK